MGRIIRFEVLLTDDEAADLASGLAAGGELASCAASANLLDRAFTPQEVVAKFAERGVHISERTLRERARKTGACRILGNAMMLLPEHVDQLWEAPEPNHPSKSTPTQPTYAARTLSDREVQAALAEMRQRNAPKRGRRVSKD